MKQKPADYQAAPYPKMRRWYAGAFRSVHHTPMIHGLLEVDVSRTRAFLREQKANTGEALSFTAFLMVSLAQAVDEHKAVQARRFGRNYLILFEEVDVLTYIERKVAGQKQIMPHIIRAATRKTLHAPAARFTQRLKDFIESGYGLFDSTVESEQPERKPHP